MVSAMVTVMPQVFSLTMIGHKFFVSLSRDGRTGEPVWAGGKQKFKHCELDSSWQRCTTSVKVTCRVIITIHEQTRTHHPPRSTTVVTLTTCGCSLPKKDL